MRYTFVPDHITKKIPQRTKEHQVLDTYFRQRRNFFLENPHKKEEILASIRKKLSIVHKETRRLFDCHNTYDFAENPLLTEEQVHSNQPSPNEALQIANISYDFYHNKFHQESFDNKSSPIDMYINFGEGYNNAFYDGLRFVFGTGDGVYFKTFLLQDIFMHELTHGVTDYKSGLRYQNQSGALSEHLSDVFAMCLKQRINREKSTAASWVVGEGLFTPKINGLGIRTFKDESAYNDNILGRDDQPKHMRDYQNLPNTEDGDYGGVHVNCGILNHAFYNLCIYAETEVSDEWSNRSWKAPLEIWYDSYNFLTPNTNFEEFAKITLQVARDNQPQLQTQVLKAWQEVGITI